MSTDVPPNPWQARLHQAWLNLRIWVPGLANPDLRSRIVAFGAREARQGQIWDIELPEQCWACGEREGLRRRSFDHDVRGFEFPLGIALGTLATAAVWLLWLSLWPGRIPLLLLVATLGMGAAAIYVKSWSDEVTLGVWFCPRHPEPPPVEFVLEEDRLHVVLPSAQLADALRKALEQRRRSRKAYASEFEDRPPAPNEPRPHAEHPLPQSFSRSTPDLPPIELADGPEDTPQGDEPTEG